MIEYHYETEFRVENEMKVSDWMKRIIEEEGYVVDKLDYIFCNDERLLSLNLEYLGHDTYTDIITFDYSKGRNISGDVFISIDRVRENALKYKEDFEKEFLRVACHGILHLMGYKDKTEAEGLEMRKKEEEKINMFHVEQ
nr:rRNA maturation RNase YbeY [uncultured Allomuricauda sp.]